MPVSIQEGVERSKKVVKAEKAIAERYPGAYLRKRPDGESVWMCDGINDDVNEALFLASDARDSVGGGHRTWLCPYVTVEGMRVFSTDTIELFGLSMVTGPRWLHAHRRFPKLLAPLQTWVNEIVATPPAGGAGP